MNCNVAVASFGVECLDWLSGFLGGSYQLPKCGCKAGLFEGSSGTRDGVCCADAGGRTGDEDCKWRSRLLD
jgi:hypothetical protein